MALDPIVSLSVAIAEAPGSYAFLLGSGVSRDAGVPTGEDVRLGVIGDLYRLENSSAEMPDRDGLRLWLEETGRGDLGYSDLLELIAPDQATRRDYLAKHFEGATPGPTHERLAALAAQGVARVFITTNFDRLLENALRAHGIEPVVVTSDADLAVAQPRELAPCYVLKPHGDYLQQTIRNTPSELAALEPGITSALQEIFDRYGLVVLGYSGNDEAIGEVFEARRSRYGLYWVSRRDPVEPARSIIEASAGRVVVREGAAEFLADLQQRLDVFAVHPSGLTPIAVHDEVLSMLRRDDSVSLVEAMRRERREFEERFTALTAGRNNEQPTNESASVLHDELMPIIERRIASLLPLLIHDRTSFESEIRALADFKERQPRMGGLGFWLELLDWVIWVITYWVGAAAVRLDRMQHLVVLFETTVTTHWATTEVFAQTRYGIAGEGIGKVVMAKLEPGNRLFSPTWELLNRDLLACGLITERYRELATENDARAALVGFDMLTNIGLDVRGERTLAHWSMYLDAADAFARRLGVPRTRAAAAEAVGLSMEDFDTKAPDALNNSHKMGSPFGGSVDGVVARVRAGAIA